MPTTGAPTFVDVNYLGPLETYRQWVSPTIPTTGSLPASAGASSGHYPVTIWPLLTHPTVSSYVSDRSQIMGWTGSRIPALPYGYYQQPAVSSPTSVINECLAPQTSVTAVGIPSPAQRHHDNVIQPLNPSDRVVEQSLDNTLVVSTK